MQHVTIEAKEDGVAWVWLDRPEVRNAFHGALITELTSCFRERLRSGTRAVVLAGRGPVFCAGADLDAMRASADLSEEENKVDAQALAELFEAVDEAPAVVIGRAHKAAFGGGAGLLACCDVVVASDDTRLAFSEVRLGLVPAVIAPYVVRKIGPSWARRTFTTGTPFDAQTALHMGLVHRVVAPDALDEAVQKEVQSVLQAGPRATIEAKALVQKVAFAPPHEVQAHCAATIARLRISDEGQEGLQAFLQKRPPSW